MDSGDPSASEPGTIAGRYRIEHELGRGGMARVYRVLDERAGRRYALKKLTVTTERSATMQAMFEREYHTLSQLAHPGIVSVFDYGLDDGSPYYTMELLEGADANETVRSGSLDVRQSCQLLCDAASALALIHSRRMVHRDIGPRNLWCTPEYRGKLIDFGTLVAMGPQRRVAGTPPFVPPEALYLQPLDARCDLYALGALAYFMLTQRHAYPARELAELREAWQHRPKPPAALNPEVPAPLSDLIMALLSQDARGRPASAGEVFERLSAIAELPAEDERGFARAFLTTPNLVGRHEAIASFRKRLLGTARRSRDTVAIVSAPGMGRSRMLASLVLEAKLVGAATVAVDATAVGSGAFALAGAIAERLLEVLPMTAAAATAIGIAPVLAHVSPALRDQLGAPVPCELSPFDRVRKLQSALVMLFEAAGRKQRLVIAVDDVHRADGASLGVLGRLAVLADDRRPLLLTSCDAGTLAQAPPALEHLVQGGTRLDLGPLGADDTRRLLESLFGAVPGLDETASWLHELSQGSPQTCMQYAQHLVDEGIARYRGGQWRLPLQLREHPLPATLDAMLERRILALSADARTLALGLALARDESRSSWQPETHVRIEDFARLLDGSEPGRAFSALDELLRAGVVQQRDSYYVLAQQAMADVLLRVAGDESASRTHARLADVFAQAGYPAVLLTVRHLQLAGEHARARQRLLAYAEANLGAGHWGAMRVSVTAECGQQALAHWQAEGGSPREGIILRRVLLFTGAVYDWSMASCSGAQLAQLRADCGLVHWDETSPDRPALERVIECLKRAHLEYEQKPEAARGMAPIDAVRELAGCAMSLIGAFVNSHDVANVKTLPAILQPLRPLSPLVAIVADLCDLAADRVVGRELGQRMSAVADRLFAASDAPQVLRVGGGVITVHFQAVEAARRGSRRALELTDALVPVVEEDAFFVQHGRWLAHAFRGQSSAAQGFRKRVEVITEDDAWRRKALLFVEAQLHALTGDLESLKRTSDAIAELADRFEGWRPWLCWSRAALHRWRGELDAADAELQAALALARPGEHRAWVLAAPAHAELTLLRGDAVSALRAAEAIVQTVATLSLDLSAAVSAERVRALGESRLGDHAAAAASLERAFALARELDYDGLPLAWLYEAQTRIALAAGANEKVATALAVLGSLLEHADAPSLLHAYEELRGESNARLAADQQPGPLARETSGTQFTQLFSELQTRFNALNERRDRAEQALELLLEECQSDAGYLLLFDGNGLFEAASVDRLPASEQLLLDVQRLLAAGVHAVQTVVVTTCDLTAKATSTSTTLSDGDAPLAPVLLSDEADGRAMLTGVALLVMDVRAPRSARDELVQAISRCLRAAGDSQPVAIES